MPVQRIVLSEQAKTDLGVIEAYIAEHDGERLAAVFRSKVDETLRKLVLMPGMGGRRSYLKRNQRAFPIPPWTIFYEEIPAQDGISVVRIIDGRRDLPALFGEKHR